MHVRVLRRDHDDRQIGRGPQPGTQSSRDDLGDRVTAESPGTMISALAAVPHFYARAAWQETGMTLASSSGARTRLSRSVPVDYFSSSTTQSTMTASRQQVLARSSPMRASLPIDVPPDSDLMMRGHPRQGHIQTDRRASLASR